MLMGAPTFEEVAGALAVRLQDAVLVAHRRADAVQPGRTDIALERDAEQTDGAGRDGVPGQVRSVPCDVAASCAAGRLRLAPVVPKAAAA